MAGEGEKTGRGVGHILDLADHPLLFAFAMVLMIVPMMALAHSLFAFLGWTGPAALFHHP